MTSFSGFSSDPSEAVVTNNGFWPDLAVAEFQAVYRLPREYAEALLVDHLALAIVWVNRQLAGWSVEQIAEGYTTLAAVPDDLQGGSMGEGKTAALLHYKRAAFSYAKALLLPQFATLNRRDQARNEGKESDESRENFLAYAEQAVADFLGHGRVDVELI